MCCASELHTGLYKAGIRPSERRETHGRQHWQSCVLTLRLIIQGFGVVMCCFYLPISFGC